MNVARWFLDNGVGVFPLHPRSKEPAVMWTTYQATSEKIERFENYGVRLGGLAVLDPDSDTLVRLVEAGSFEVPDTPFIVKTARGRHLYYRLAPSEKAVPKFVRRNGTSIEFRNKGQYVVGPGSIHPTGVVYEAIDWSWRFEDIPYFPVDAFCFDDGSVKWSLAGAGSFEMPEAVHEPERHETLNSFIAHLVTSTNAEQFNGDTPALLAYVTQFARLFCANVCQPPLRWDSTLDGFVRRSFDGALKLKNRPRQIVDPFGDF